VREAPRRARCACCGVPGHTTRQSQRQSRRSAQLRTSTDRAARFRTAAVRADASGPQRRAVLPRSRFRQAVALAQHRPEHGGRARAQRHADAEVRRTFTTEDMRTRRLTQRRDRGDRRGLIAAASRRRVESTLRSLRVLCGLCVPVVLSRRTYAALEAPGRQLESLPRDREYRMSLQ
jgi:hypothetical protein